VPPVGVARCERRHDAEREHPNPDRTRTDRRQRPRPQRIRARREQEERCAGGDGGRSLECEQRPYRGGDRRRPGRARVRAAKLGRYRRHAERREDCVRGEESPGAPRNQQSVIVRVKEVEMDEHHDEEKRHGERRGVGPEPRRRPAALASGHE
jgi:hypothetical protein